MREDQEIREMERSGNEEMERGKEEHSISPFPPLPIPRPFGLLAEMTDRCPLHCPYCSNPTRYPPGEELTTAEWRRVIGEASDLGVLHILFSGGEPLLRPDLPELVAAAREAGLYTNLITSAIGLTPARAAQLKAAGLDSVQISFQAEEASLADTIAGFKAHARKREAARLVREHGFPLTVNVVLHRGNIGRIEALIALAEEVGAERLELANTQFYGWAFKNREALLPTRAQLERADRVAAEAKARLRGRMDVLYILPDYFGDYPKPCMNGWGQRYLTVNPVGDVLPCPTAGEIPDMRFENVRQRTLAEIWAGSEAFNRFRGTAWMPEPCRSCARRELDFGGCRCQAALLTGDAANTDPACVKAPHRQTLTQIVAAVQAQAEEENALPFAADIHAVQYRANPIPQRLQFTPAAMPDPDLCPRSV
jgi:pyrroloquinoline quinone biosynthesis protein E